MIYGIIWTLAIIIFLTIEATTSALVSIWFAGGSLAGLICHLFGASVKIQILVFLIVSVALVLLLRNVAVKSFKKISPKTDLDRIIGQKVVISGVAEQKNLGTTRIGDIEWKVRSEKGEDLFVGETVTVEKIEGVYLVVNK